MDTPGGSIENTSDKVLRDLFRGFGTVQAPEGLESAVINRLAHVQKRVAVQEKPLLPSWVWIMGLVAMLVFIFLVLSQNGSPEVGSFTMPVISLSPIIGSAWFMMVLIAVAAFLAMDALLGRRQFAPRTH